MASKSPQENLLGVHDPCRPSAKPDGGNFLSKAHDGPASRTWVRSGIGAFLAGPSFAASARRAAAVRAKRRSAPSLRNQRHVEGLSCGNLLLGPMSGRGGPLSSTRDSGRAGHRQLVMEPSPWRRWRGLTGRRVLAPRVATTLFAATCAATATAAKARAQPSFVTSLLRP